MSNRRVSFKPKENEGYFYTNSQIFWLVIGTFIIGLIIGGAMFYTPKELVSSQNSSSIDDIQEYVVLKTPKKSFEELAVLECKSLGFTDGTEIYYGIFGSEIRCFLVRNGVLIKTRDFAVNWTELQKHYEKEGKA